MNVELKEIVKQKIKRGKKNIDTLTSIRSEEERAGSGKKNRPAKIDARSIGAH